MTPSNPDNNQPLIYRIADALGVFHLVAPVNHTHSTSEIDGLADALAAKQDALTFDTTPTEGSTNPVTSGGVKAALDGKADTSHGHKEIRQTNSDDELALVSATANEDGDLYIMLSLREVGEQTKSAKITYDNIANLIRALSDPDSTPTVNSTKLVTSGGVKTAIDLLSGIVQGYYHRQWRYIEGKEMLGGFYLKEWVADNSHRAFVIKNEDDTGDVITVADLVDLDAGETIIYLGSSSSISADENEYLYFDVYRRSTKYYINALKG